MQIRTGSKDGLLNQKQEKVFSQQLAGIYIFEFGLAELSTLSAQGHSLYKDE